VNEIITLIISLKNSQAGKMISAYLIMCAVIVFCLDIFDQRIKTLETYDKTAIAFHATSGGPDDPLIPAVNNNGQKIAAVQQVNAAQAVAIGKLESNVKNLERTVYGHTEGN